MQKRGFYGAFFGIEEDLSTNLYDDWRAFNKQYNPSDTSPIDILAISKNKKTILVIELKRGRASDIVIGQIQRYMGYVQDELLETGQEVKGIIVGSDAADDRIEAAKK